MKLTVLPLVVAALGLTAQVSAGPIRIYVLDPEGAAVSKSNAHDVPAVGPSVAHMRWGLAASNAPKINSAGVWQANHTNETVDIMPMTMRKHRCAAGPMRMKAIAFSNWVREKMGLEPIVPHMHGPHRHLMGHRPEDMHGDAKMVWAPVHGTAQTDEEDRVVDGPRFHHFHHHDHHHHHHRPHTFIGRVQRALMTLGPWEGRFVAFVIGCGLGSLLRMFYVLCVVAYRSFTSRKDEEEVEVIFTEVEQLQPPEYSPDQKLVVEDHKTSA